MLHALFHGLYPNECFPENVGAHIYELDEADAFDYDLLIPFLQMLGYFYGGYRTIRGLNVVPHLRSLIVIVQFSDELTSSDNCSRLGRIIATDPSKRLVIPVSYTHLRAHET